jgi:hypothetical protein
VLFLPYFGIWKCYFEEKKLAHACCNKAGRRVQAPHSGPSTTWFSGPNARACKSVGGCSVCSNHNSPDQHCPLTLKTRTSSFLERKEKIGASLTHDAHSCIILSLHCFTTKIYVQSIYTYVQYSFARIYFSLQVLFLHQHSYPEMNIKFILTSFTP